MRYLGIDLAWGEGSDAKPANRSGVAAMEADGTIVDAGWTIGVDETLTWIERVSTADTLLFVDAPLVVTNPDGMREAERETGRRYGRWWVSANATNLRSPRLAGVRLREHLEVLGWLYDDGRDGPPVNGRALSECYPYTAIVGIPELGYEDKRPGYKRAPKGVRAAEAWPLRTAACDGLIARLDAMAESEPPLRLRSHPETRELCLTGSPARIGEYKKREDLLDAVICAWTASYWHRHGLSRCQVLGLPDEPPAGIAIGTIIAPARSQQRP